MIIEFNVGEQANLVEHELTRPTCTLDTRNVVTIWVGPGQFRLVGDDKVLQQIVAQRWANLRDLAPATLIKSE